MRDVVLTSCLIFIFEFRKVLVRHEGIHHA